MKRIILLLFCLGFGITTFGQSITLEPDGLQLPRFAVNPACTVNDKGKQIYNTAQNTVLYCNGSIWVSNEGGGNASLTPAFSTYNFISKTLTISQSTVELYSKNYDLTNSVNLNSDASLPNRFVVPEKGIYQFNFYAALNLITFTPTADTRVMIVITQQTTNGSVNYYAHIPVYINDNYKYINISKSLPLLPGDKISVAAAVFSPPTNGIIKLNDVVFEGHLIARN